VAFLRRLAVAFNRSFNTAKKFVSQGRLGNLHYAERTYFHDVEDMHRVVQETPWRVGKLNGVAQEIFFGGDVHPAVKSYRTNLPQQVCKI
jgi:predicted dehydrogenase